MDELDQALRAMAKCEDFSLPPAYETAMDGLEEQARRGTLPRRGKRRLGRRMLLLAAAAAVLLAATAVSMDFWHVQLGEISVGDEESSYDVEADLPGVPMEAFSEQVEEALAEIRQAFRAYQPGDSRYPGSWSRYCRFIWWSRSNRPTADSAMTAAISRTRASRTAMAAVMEWYSSGSPR